MLNDWQSDMALCTRPVLVCLFLSLSFCLSFAAYSPVGSTYHSVSKYCIYLEPTLTLKSCGTDFTTTPLWLCISDCFFDKFFFFFSNVNFAMSPLSSSAVLVHFHSQSTCSIHKGETFTLASFSAWLFRVCFFSHVSFCLFFSVLFFVSTPSTIFVIVSPLLHLKATTCYSGLRWIRVVLWLQRKKQLRSVSCWRKSQ